MGVDVFPSVLFLYERTIFIRELSIGLEEKKEGTLIFDSYSR